MVAVIEEDATGANMTANDAELKLRNNLANSTSEYVRYCLPRRV